MTRGRAAILLLGLSLFATGCARQPDAPRKQSAADSAAAAAFAPSVNAFGLDLYRTLASTQGNLAISPLSLSSCLGMACAGARGRTRDEMERVLHLSGDFSSGYRSLRERIAAQPGGTWTLANRIWVRKGAGLKSGYRRMLGDDFGTTAGTIDLGHDPEAARIEMNKWFSDQTAGHIAELFPPGSIDAMTYLVLGNAVYFVGKWNEPFNKAGTQPSPFHVTRDSSISVSMMHWSGEPHFLRIPDARLVELPYQGGALSFLIVLPDSIDGLPALETRLTADSLAIWCSLLAPKQVSLALPRFEARSSYLLTPPLEELGMKSAFTEGADFADIASRKPLFLGAVAHQVYVHVDEEGTVAAAATGAEVTTSTTIIEFIEFVTVDHPFLFAIRDRSTGCLLFLGRCVQP